MGNDEQRFPARPRQLEQQVDNRVAGLGIEIAGRLVGKNNVGIVGQGASNGHALLFAPGKFRRQMMQPVPQPNVGK